ESNATLYTIVPGQNTFTSSSTGINPGGTGASSSAFHPDTNTIVVASNSSSGGTYFSEGNASSVPLWNDRSPFATNASHTMNPIVAYRPWAKDYVVVYGLLTGIDLNYVKIPADTLVPDTVNSETLISNFSSFIQNPTLATNKRCKNLLVAGALA